MTLTGQSQPDDPPHVSEIKDCDETVEINRLALVRLLMMGERLRGTNGSDRVAVGLAFDALGVDGLCRKTDDITIE